MIVVKHVHERVLLHLLEVLVDEHFVDAVRSHPVRGIDPQNIKQLFLDEGGFVRIGCVRQEALVQKPNVHRHYGLIGTKVAAYATGTVPARVAGLAGCRLEKRFCHQDSVFLFGHGVFLEHALENVFVGLLDRGRFPLLFWLVVGCFVVGTGVVGVLTSNTSSTSDSIAGAGADNATSSGEIPRPTAVVLVAAATPVVVVVVVVVVLVLVLVVVPPEWPMKGSHQRVVGNGMFSTDPFEAFSKQRIWC
mmetsp:Transcript_15533/g.35601  ORF Transcript_15533/g.35601 Transcript_15533/m.35601 type:complete len:248 (-) Transcript_15533:102-845(-)